MATRESAQPAATTAATKVDDKTAEVALSLFEHIEDQINRTDTKAQVVLAADALLLGWFSTQNPNLMQALLAGPSSAIGRVSALLVALVFVGLFLSLACGLVVIWPRSGVSKSSTLIYFGDIARQSERDFVAAFLRQSQADVMEQILRSVHATARIAGQKFRWVGLSIAFLLATLVLWIALEVVHLAAP